MAAKTTKTRAKKDTRSTEDKLIDAALDLAAERPWRDVRLSDIAEGAGIGLGEALLSLPSKLHILKAFARRTDKAVFESLAVDPLDGTVKEKLFDILMRRFDVLEGRQAALASITRDLRKDPVAALCMAKPLAVSMAMSLEAAGAGTSGCASLVRSKALSAIYLATADVWLKDEDPGLAQTMARLDKLLGRAEQFANGGFSLRNRANNPDPAPESSPV